MECGYLLQTEDSIAGITSKLCSGHELGALKIDDEEESEKPWGTYRIMELLVAFAAHRIISKAKALTTRQDLRIGILNSLSALDAGVFPEVKLVSLSTTLATNSRQNPHRPATRRTIVTGFI
jgi:hypothetical protein